MPEITLNLTDEQLEQLKKQFPEKFVGGYFAPKKGDAYYPIFSDGRIRKNTNDGFDIDKDRIKYGRYTKTEKEAEQKNAFDAAVQEVKVWISENLGVFNPDWKDFDQRKYLLFYDNEDKKIDYVGYNVIKHYNPIGYLRSEEDCEKLKAAKNEQLELIFK